MGPRDLAPSRKSHASRLQDSCCVPQPVQQHTLLCLGNPEETHLVDCAGSCAGDACPGSTCSSPAPTLRVCKQISRFRMSRHTSVCGHRPRALGRTVSWRPNQISSWWQPCAAQWYDCWAWAPKSVRWMSVCSSPPDYVPTLIPLPCDYDASWIVTAWAHAPCVMRNRIHQLMALP